MNQRQTLDSPPQEAGTLRVSVPAVDDGSMVSAPVEVRDGNLRLRGRGRSRSEIPLHAGTYVVSVALPDGSRAVELARVQPGTTTDLRIPWQPDQISTLEARGKARLSGARGAVGKLPNGFALRFVGIEGGRMAPLPDEVEPEVVKVDDGATVLIASIVLRLHSERPALRYAELAADGQPPLTVALPLAPQSEALSCRLNVALTAVALDAEVELGGIHEANLVARMVAGGDLPQVKQLPDIAELLLREKRQHPLGAALGGYALLRLGEIDRLHDWHRNLARRFPWLPDGTVISAEQAFRTGDPETGFGFLRQTIERGLPVLTDGFSLLVNRLQAIVRGQVPKLDAAQYRDAGLEWLQPLIRRAPFVDLGSLVLALRGTNLARPGEVRTSLDQTPADSGWRLFRVPLGRPRGPQDYWRSPHA